MRPGLAESGPCPKRCVVTNPILAASDEPFRQRALERLLAAGVDDLQVADLPGVLADLLRDTKRSIVVVGGDWDATRPFLRVAVNSGALPVVLLDSSGLAAEGEALAMGARAALQSDIPITSLAAALTAVDAGLMVLEPSARAILRTDPSTGRVRLASELERSYETRSPGDAEMPRETRPPHSADMHRETRPPRDTETPHETRPPHDADIPRETRPPRGAGVLRDPPDPTPRRNGRPLTSREREILTLVASGTSNKGIARALAVSANTVKFHLAAVFDKLNASTRAEAVAEAIRRGDISL
jgi:DNA-binding NarL/FixJ family response regulator